MAMQGNKYPITQIGVKNLVRRLIEVGTQDMKYGECDVTYRKNAKVNDRVCTIIEVTHPVPRRNFIFHKALIYVDDQLNLPIRYEAYTWPKTQGGPPELDEEYTYLNLKVNVGLTDADFEPANPNYHFK
jgi:outer membrane lipoprotein-sorting protein